MELDRNDLEINSTLKKWSQSKSLEQNTMYWSEHGYCLWPHQHRTCCGIGVTSKCWAITAAWTPCYDLCPSIYIYNIPLRGKSHETRQDKSTETRTRTEESIAIWKRTQSHNKNPSHSEEIWEEIIRALVCLPVLICKRLLLQTFFFQCITVLEGKQHCRVPVNFQWTVPWVQIRLKDVEMKSQSIKPNLFKSAFKSLQCWATYHWNADPLSPMISPPAPRGAEGCHTLEQQARVLHEQREVGKDKDKIKVGLSHSHSSS